MLEITMVARDPPVPARRRRTVLAAILGAVLLTAGVATYLATRPAADQGATAAPRPARPARPILARPSRPTPPPSRSPAARVPNDVVRPAVPTAFTLTG